MANNRYYSNAYGRFMTPDLRGGNPADSRTWNRYAYTGGDPVNFVDPSGTVIYWALAPDDGGGGGGDEFDNGFQDTSGYCDPSQGPGSCGNPCVGVDGFTPSPSPYCQGIPTPVGAPAPPPPKITLRVVDECILPNGIGITLGAFTLAVEYQVLVNGQPLLGNYSLSSAGISLVTETVTTTSGGPFFGGGNWCISGTQCDEPGSLSPSGTFWDLYSGNGTANQSYQINGQTIAVTFPNGGVASLLNNVYNSKGNSISLGSGALTSSLSIRECGTKHGDP